MWLKLILIGVILYYLYKAFGGKFELPKGKKESVDDENTLVECCKCSTYITKKEAIFRGGKYYCDECA